MITSLPAFAGVEAAFARIVEAPTPTSFDARTIAGLPARIIPPDELRELLTSTTLDADVADALWRQLVHHVRQWGEEWMLIAAGLALPALTRMAGQILHRRNHNADDVASEMLAAFLHGLRETPLEPPRLWLRLCWASWRAGVAATSSADTSELVDDLPTGSRTPHRPYGHPDLLIGRAVAAGVLTAAQAELISRTRLGGDLLPQVAAEQGVSPAAMQLRRARSERKLVAALRQGLLTVVPTAKPRPEPDVAVSTGTRVKTPQPRVRTAEPRVRTPESRVRTANPRVRTAEPRVRSVLPRVTAAARVPPLPR